MVAFTEKPNSRQTSTTPPRITYRYTCSDTIDEEWVRALTLSATPLVTAAAGAILYRQDVQIEPQGWKLWDVTVPYGPRDESPQVGQYTLSFDTTGGTIHITSSKETVAHYPFPDGIVADYKQLIGVNDGQVEGADVVIPALKVSVNYRHPIGLISLAQIKNFARYTGCVNSDSFLTFSPGEVLFLGATGSEGTNSETDVTYQFAMSQNVSGLTIGDIAGIVKKGHDLAWIKYKKAVDDKRPVRQPDIVYIERVYNRAALGMALGFGN